MTNEKKHNRLWFLALLAMIVFVVGFRTVCISPHAKNTNVVTNEKYFAIMPHFTIQPKTISTFYEFLKKTYHISSQEPVNIVLMSPDHFNILTGNIAQFCGTKICYQGICLPDQKQALP